MADGDEGMGLDAQRPRATGRLIVRFDPALDGAGRFGIVANVAGREIALQAAGSASDDFGAAGPREAPCAALLSRLGLCLVPMDRDMGTGAMMQRLEASEGVRSVRPEFYLFPASAPAPASALRPREPFRDSRGSTWGLSATGAAQSRLTGRGIRLCVLDTGLDLTHPDFSERAIVSRSFVEGEGVQDVQGHGTHCAGTAVGAALIDGRMRYGVAPEAELYVGKVLNDTGAGREGDILAGLVWAVEEGCQIVSMSLGRSVRPGEARTPEYEEAGAYALERGSLVVAAAGNDSRREYGFVAPVSEPANAPSILAVGALDPRLAVAPFSNGGVEGEGGEVDLAGPGVGVLSAVPIPRRYASFDGTSMACPHVAGLAALFAQGDETLRGRALWDALTAGAEALAEAARDVGAGLARAPVEEDAPTS